MKDGAGRLGEDYAAQRLLEMGYRIVARNYHCRFGEIDIIGENGQYLVFVEVKARDSQGLTSPLEAVTRQKQRKLILTAQSYLAVYPTSLQPRFDVAAVELRAGKVLRWEYLENAFLA